MRMEADAMFKPSAKVVKFWKECQNQNHRQEEHGDFRLFKLLKTRGTYSYYLTSAQILACNLQFNLVCGDQTMHLITIVLAFFYEIT